MASFPDKDWCLEAHGRLVGGDLTASAELCKAILSPLVGWLYAKGRTTDKELIRDAATDALVDYVKHPHRWNQESGTLVSYICMAADRDLLNALEKVQRRRKREVLIADVEDEEFDRLVPGDPDRDLDYPEQGHAQDQEHGPEPRSPGRPVLEDQPQLLEAATKLTGRRAPSV